MLVMDGNMKYHRDVCLAKEAGYAEFSGLSGRIKTGCPNTPLLKSRFCSDHDNTAFHPVGEITDPVLESVERDQQVAYITDKKTTRQTTFYQASIVFLVMRIHTHAHA